MIDPAVLDAMVASGSSRIAALELEAELLGMMPDLVNRARPTR